MSDYGQFSTSGEVFIGARTTVFEGHPIGEELNGNRVAIKVYHNRFLEEGETDTLKEEFVRAARFHREVHTEIPGVCIPFLENGESVDGKAWAIMPYAGFSLEQMLDYKMQPSPQVIYLYVIQLLKQLQVLRNKTGRGHGNLKASNIFLEGKGKLEHLKIRLSDFAPLLDPSRKGEFEKRDLGAVGKMIYRLVRGQEAKSSAVSDSEDWEVFGKKKADLWRAFCEDLLRAGDGISSLSLEHALDQLPSLKPEKKKPVAAFGVAGFLLFAGGLIGLHFYLPEGLIGLFTPTPEEIPMETQQHWVEIVTAYNDWGKVVDESLRDAINAGSGTFWHSDPYLANEVLNRYEADLNSGEVEMDPWELLDRRIPWQTINETPPDILARQRYVDKALNSVLFMNRLRLYLERWPVPDQLDASAQRFTELGFEAPASEITEVRETYQVDDQIPERIRTIIEVLRNANQADRQWETVSARAEILSNEGRVIRDSGVEDAVLVQAEDYALNAGATTETVSQLSIRLSEVDSQFIPIQEAIESEAYAQDTDINLFRVESFISAVEGLPGEAEFQLWIEQVGQYRFLDPAEVPLQPDTWSVTDAAVVDLLANIRIQDAEMREAGEDSGLTPELLQGFDAILDGVRQQAVEVVRLPLVLKNRGLMEQTNQEILNALDGLQSELITVLENMVPSPDVWLDRINGYVVSGPAILNTFWTQRRDAILAGTPRSAWENDPDEYRRMRREVKNQRLLFSALNTPEALALGTIDSTGMPSDLNSVVQSLVDVERSQVLDAMVELVPLAADGVSPEAFLVREEIATLRDRFSGYKTSAESIGQGFQPARQALDIGFGLEETPGQYYEQWQDHPVFQSLSDVEPVSTFVTDIGSLVSLRDATDLTPQDVVQRAQGQGGEFLALSYQAYRKLDDFENWPATEADYASDSGAWSSLLSRTTGEVRNAVEQLGQDRWRQSLEVAPDPARMDAAFLSMGQYELSNSDLSERNQLKYFLHSEIAQLQSNPNLRTAEGTEVEGDKQGILRRLSENETFSTVSERGNIEGALNGFDPTIPKPEPGPRELGPATVGWTFEDSLSTQDNYIYSWEDPYGFEHQLEFLRIVNPDGGSFFIGTTEAYLGLFSGVVFDLGVDNWPDLQEYFFIADSSSGRDTRNGPRVWEVEYDSGEILPPRDDWLNPLPGVPAVIADRYFNGQGLLPPDEFYPIQHLPPELALGFAERLGCTIPTPEIWEYMVQTFPNVDPTDDNIRDSFWEQQRAFVANSPNYQDAPASNLPWPDRESFSTYLIPEVAEGRAAQVVDSVHNDGFIYFADVEARGQDPAEELRHLFGNVSEFLFDGQDFYVAGASALSPPEVTPNGYRKVEGLVPNYGYSDVGFRLCFVIDLVPPGFELRNILRAQYAYMATPASPES